MKKFIPVLVFCLMFIVSCSQGSKDLDTKIISSESSAKMQNKSVEKSEKKDEPNESSLASKEDGIAKFALTKTRFVFEPGQRGETLTIVNTGTKTSVYRSNFINRKMFENGLIDTIYEKEKDGMYSDDLIYVTPREFTIKPGRSQTVNLFARRPKDLKEGEYRSHLKFVILPSDIKSSLVLDKEDEGKDEFSLKIQSRPGFSVPVILRHGDNLNVTVKISDAELIKEDEKDVLNLTLVREGNISSNGDITVNHISQDGSECQVNNMKGISVYTDVEKRAVNLNLNPCEGQPLNNGRLEIEYEYDGKMASKKLDL